MRNPYADAAGVAKARVPTIYHLCALAELRAGTGEHEYAPARFAEDGFVHCAEGKETALAVARDYFAAVSDEVVVLRIDPALLTANLVFEGAAPIAGGDTAHLQCAQLWPHIYGPINLTAIDGAAVLRRGERGEFLWPQSFEVVSRVAVVPRLKADTCG